MSQTADDAEATVSPQDNLAVFHEMLAQGRSLSGNERNCLYLNTGQPTDAESRAEGPAVTRFANVSSTTGFDFPDDARGLALVDWDHDGDLDLWISNRNAPRLRFLRNESRRAGRSVAIRLAGNGTTSNRDAIGARVEVVTDPSSPFLQIKTLRAGEGFISQNSKWMHFGLGNVNTVEKVIVHWPGGEKEEFADLAAGRRYLLTQGSGQAQSLSVADRHLKLVPENQTVPEQSGAATLRLMVPLEMPPLAYKTADGRNETFRTRTGKPLLVNLWATWCQPCAKELRDIIKHQDEIREAGLQILALSVDGLGDDDSNAEAAAEHLKAIGYPFASGHATATLLDQLQAIHDLQTPLHSTLPLPSSILLDAQGRLLAIYKGPVSIEKVLADSSQHASSIDEGYQNAAAIPGSVLNHQEAINSLKREASTQRTRLATWLRQNRYEAEAAVQYGKIVELFPNSASARVDLGAALIRLKQVEPARKQFEKALEIQPKTYTALTNLGQIRMNQERYAEAREHFEGGLELSPDNVPLLNNLGTVLGELHDYPKAIEYFVRATEVQPDDPGGHNNLAWLLATCPDAAHRDVARAIAIAERACELSGWKNHSTIDTLAAAYAATGRFNSAVRWATQALTLAPEVAKPEIRRHLQLYQAGKAYEAETTE